MTTVHLHNLNQIFAVGTLKIYVTCLRQSSSVKLSGERMTLSALGC